MKITRQRERAERLRRLHEDGDILVVGSAWDPGSAVIFESMGFPAIATSSAGIANSLGYPDGERLPLEEMLAAVARIVRAVSVPVSADMESGFGTTPEVVAQTCQRLLETGAVGVNLEDATPDGALEDPLRQVEKIRAVREMAQNYGVPLVINARTDRYWLRLGEDETRFKDSVARATLYRQAGADCVFVPGLTDAGIIGRLVAEIPAPLNILASAGAPSVAELAALGVRRVSQGSGPARAALSGTLRAASELKKHGTYSAYTESAVDYARANRLFRPD